MVRMVNRRKVSWKGQIHLDHADNHAAEDVDQRDDDPGDGVAADELASAVHGPVEIRFAGDLGTAALASSSVMLPALRSASTAICFAGHAVQGEAAATRRCGWRSLVMTTNWMITMIAKMTAATASDPWATNPPKVATTCPALPCVNTSLVVATLSTRRNSVSPKAAKGTTKTAMGRQCT